MFKQKYFKISAWLVLFIALEIGSFIGLYSPLADRVFFFLLILGSLLITVYRLEYGLLLIAAELFVGSMGHLFTFQVLAGDISLRMVLWAVVMLVFIVKFFLQLIENGKNSDYYRRLKAFSYLKYFAWLFLFIFLALANGLGRGHSLSVAFLDFNAWLYFFLLFPLTVVYNQPEKKIFENLKIVFLTAAVWLSLKTLFLLFVFTHNLSLAPDIYHWLRQTLVGEMTATKTGWPRIFIQGQIFPLIALILLFWQQLGEWAKGKIFSRSNFLVFLAGSLFFGIALISFSRSFWVGLVAAFIFSFAVALFMVPKKRVAASAGWLVSVALAGFALIYLVAIFPYPAPGTFNADFLSRLSDSNEAAVSSRWSLLPVLISAVDESPLIGQGYGATVTYFSRDPRVLEKSPTGEYTTSAFEWGYLDLWLKLGSLGLVVYLLLLLSLVIGGFRLFKKNNNYLAIGLSAGVIFLAAVNIFTPYLNHPLGIGFLLLSSCLISLDRV